MEGKYENNINILQEKIMEALDWAYNASLNGLYGERNIYDLTEEYLKSNSNDVEKAIDKLVNVQTVKAATSGFITGLGGMITMPVAIPANVASVILFQVRMISSIALMRGYDLKSDLVQTFVYACLTGKAVSDLLKGAGLKLADKIALQGIKKIPGEVLKKVNQKVGFRLATKAGEKGIVNFAKLLPFVGGFVGAGFDIASTVVIAKAAKSTFLIDGINLEVE